MDQQFEFLKVTRNNILKELEDCSIDQLFKIPTGFNNHILWNAVHVIATQQLLMYGFTKTPYRIDASIVDNYRKGTTPSEEINMDMVDFAKNNLISTISQSQVDYKNNLFGPYNFISTSYGVTLNTIEDAVAFLNLHESMHFGQIKMLKKMV